MSEILVVDDKLEIRRLFTRVLEREGYRVRTAVNGDKALEAIYVRKPDLVLMDIDMPRRNGYSTCEEIRRFDRLLPVIFLTAFDTQTNELRARGLGADDFFSKAADSAVILAAVRRALARGEAFAKTASAGAEVIHLGRVTVDFNKHRVLEDGKEIARITATESDILKLLCSERGRHFNNDAIYSATRGEGYVGDPSTIRSHIYHLRMKLGSAGDCIVGERDVGYALIT